MFQRGGSHAEFQCRPEILSVQKSADYASCERISSAHTINNGVDAVFFRMLEFFGISGVNAG